MKLNWLTLSFKGNLEKEFLSDYFDSSIILLRLSFILGILYYSFFGLLDVLALPAIKSDLHLIRYAIVCPVILLVFILSFTKRFRQWWQLSAAIAIVVAGTGIVAMTIIAPDSDRISYYVGSILVLIYCYMLIRLRFIYAMIAGTTIVVIYILSLKIFPGISPETRIVNIFFMISANLLGMFGGYVLEFYTRKEFYFRHLLKLESKKVEEINADLEKRIEAKTILLQEDIQKRKVVEKELRTHQEKLEEMVRERTITLEKQNEELTRFNKLFVDREFRIKELRDEVKELKNKLS